MTAISTKVTPEQTWRVEIADYPEDMLRREYEEDVRSFDQVMTDNFGAEGEGWEFRKESIAANIGHLLVYPAGDAHFVEVTKQRHGRLHQS